MAKCICGLEMLDDKAVSCLIKYVIVDGKKYKRNTTYCDVNKRCHDCNIVNWHNHIHHWGCDIERCPNCGSQLISCNCKLKNPNTSGGKNDYQR